MKKIYYVMDTMCGWCYGFSDVMSKIEEKYNEYYEFSILPGGMWIGDNSKTIDLDLGKYIKSHNIRIENLTNKKFGNKYNENILENTNIVLDSMPGAKALVLIQRLKPEVSFKFLKKIQEAFFIEGKYPSDIEVYIEIAKSFNIPKDEFIKEFLSDELEKETYKCFDRVNSMGQLSFPTVILINENKGKIISQGYSSFEELDKILEKQINS